MEDLNFRKGDAKTEVFGSNRMLQPSPVEKIPDGPTTPEIAYQMVKDETFAQTQPRLNLATFVTTYMDEYATKLMNEAININYIDETEYPRIAVMNGKCINIVANLWNSPEKETWKTGALAIGSSEACMLGGVAAWLRWRKKRQAQGKPFDKPNFVISTGFQVVWEKFAQLWQIEMREVPLTLDKTTLDPEEALKMCDENTICIGPIQGGTWSGLNGDVDALAMADIEKNIKTLALKGRDRKLTVDDLTGGNFTITNGGVFGSLMSTPIINPPQSAILGMHAIKDRPMAVDGKVEILPMMYLALSYDHRLIDGRESVGFLVAIKELLEDPTRLLLDV